MTNLSRQERAGVCQALQHMRKTGNAAAGSPLDAADMSSLSTTESHRRGALTGSGLTPSNVPMADFLKPRYLDGRSDRASNAEQPRSERTAAPLQRNQMETMPRMATSPCMLGKVEVLPAAIRNPHAEVGASVKTAASRRADDLGRGVAIRAGKLRNEGTGKPDCLSLSEVVKPACTNRLPATMRADLK